MMLQAAQVEFKRKLEGHLGEYKQLGVAEEALCCLWVTVGLKGEGTGVRAAIEYAAKVHGSSSAKKK